MKLSVIMPIRHIDQFLKQSLLSVERQTYRDFELIMICNTKIKALLKHLISEIPINFSYRIIDTKLDGVAFAANLGIAEASGEYIARWDSDDLCDPQRFDRQINELTRDKSLAVVGTRVEIINEHGVPSKFQRFKFFEDNYSIRRALKYRQPLLHSSLTFRSNILFQNKGYLYGHTSEDHELFIRIARNKSLKFKNIPDVITYYRRHSSQLSDLSNAKIHFCEISGFMFSEFLRTGNPLYILGIILNFPPIRRFRYSYRCILQFGSKII